MILEQLRDAFDTEADILNQALSIEKQKTPIILQAQGKRLKELSDRSDLLLSDLSQLEEERHHLFQSFIESSLPNVEPRIESFISALTQVKHSAQSRLSSQEWPSMIQELILSVTHFRDTASALKKEVHANQQLLNKTRRVLQNVLNDIDKPSPAYSPHSKIQHKTGPTSIMVNMNA